MAINFYFCTHRSSNRDNKSRYARIYAHVVKTIDGDWHRGRTRSGTEGCGEHLWHLQNISIRQFPNDTEEDYGNRAEAVNEEAEHDGHEVFSQFPNHLRKRFHLEDFSADEEENSDRGKPNEAWSTWENKIRKRKENSYQITQRVIIIIASLNETRKSWIGFPRSRIFPIVAPSTTLNITKPKTFIPSRHCPLILNDVNGTTLCAQLWWVGEKNYTLKIIFFGIGCSLQIALFIYLLMW